MAMPVSLRRGDDPMGGNKFAGALLAGPVGSATRWNASPSSAGWC